VNILTFGDAALLVELDDLDEVLRLAAAVRSAGWDGVLDVVPAARTVLVVTEPGTALDPLVERVTSLSSTAAAATTPADSGEPVEIAVTYDGPDLAEVARLTGLSEDEVVEAHTGRPWRIAFGGFAPGFAYLTDGDPRLAVPRRDEPRTTVPAGSVGLAGEYSGVYPRSSPGGWQLIGWTEAVLWDADRDPPALLSPGGSVRFRAVS
jgi:KipI family sensor histidine kinase inhibitor